MRVDSWLTLHSIGSETSIMGKNNKRRIGSKTCGL